MIDGRQPVRLVSASLVLWSLASLGSGCVVQRFERRTGSAVVHVAAADESCRLVLRKGRWYLLFGAIPLGAPQVPVVAAGAIRITDRVTALDLMLTVLGGWALTLTRRTLEVEQCAAPVVGEPLWLASVLDRLSGGVPVVVEVSPKQEWKGRVVEISPKSILLEQTFRTKRRVPLDRLLKKDGRQLIGIVADQDEVRVALVLESGVRMIVPKWSIRRIEYGVINDSVSVRRRLISRTDITRIRLPAPE